MNRLQTVLITGASSGIGRELARIFSSHHYNVILVARDRVALESLAIEIHRQTLVTTQVEVCDLSDRGQLEELIDRLRRDNQVVDVLVNNAGYGVEGPFSETDWETERSMIDVNVLALVRLTKAFLPQMISRNSGKILQMGSTAAFQPGPFYSLYFASKAFVLSFSDAIAAELKGTGVTLTTVCPGPTHSGFEKRLGVNPTLFSNGIPIANAPAIAQFAFEALMAGKRVAIPGTTNRILKWIAAISPRSLVLFVMVKILKRRNVLRPVQAKNFSAS